MADERRVDLRLPVEICVHQYVSEVKYLGLTRDLSERGIHLSRFRPPGEHTSWLGRELQLEFALPGTGEVVWAAGEVCHNYLDGMTHGLGIQLRAMADRHATALRKYVEQVRKARLQNLLLQVQRNRRPSLPGAPRAHVHLRRPV